MEAGWLSATREAVPGGRSGCRPLRSVVVAVCRQGRRSGGLGRRLQPTGEAGPCGNGAGRRPGCRGAGGSDRVGACGLGGGCNRQGELGRLRSNRRRDFGQRVAGIRRREGRCCRIWAWRPELPKWGRRKGEKVDKGAGGFLGSAEEAGRGERLGKDVDLAEEEEYGVEARVGKQMQGGEIGGRREELLWEVAGDAGGRGGFGRA